MLTAYSRVTVVTAERTVDLALPSALPVGDVVPQVLRFCAPESNGEPVSWTLARLGGQTLSLTQTLQDAGVLDGELLELRSQDADVRPALVEDVRDAIEDSTDAAGGSWQPRTTVTFTLLAGAVVLVVAAAATLLFPTLLEAPSGTARTSASVATAALLGAVWWATRFTPAWVGQVCAAAAMLWGFVLGGLMVDDLDLAREIDLVVAVAVATLVAGLARVLTPGATGHLAASTVALVWVVALALGYQSSIDDLQLYRILPVVGVLVVGVVPRLSLSVGGVASADYRVRHVGQLTLERLRARYRESNAILVGTLWGISALLAYCGTTLTLSDDPWDRYLAVALALAGLLRSRVFSRVQHMVALRIAGLGVLALQVLRLGVDEPASRPWLTLLAVAGFLLALGVSSLQMSEITRARVKRLLNVAEFLVVVVTVVLLAGATGVFERLGHLVER